METLVIRYTCSKLEKYTATISSIFLFAISLYLTINEAMLNNYYILFFLGIAGTIIGLFAFFVFSWWQPKPLISIDSQTITSNLPKTKNKIVEWNTIKNIAIGGGYIKVTSNEEIFLDLSAIKQSDINKIKSKTVEICDTKGITFHND